MPSFQYRGRTAEGRVVEGTVDSPDRAGAIRLLEKQRCFPIQVRSTDNNGAPEAASPSGAPPKKAPPPSPGAPAAANGKPQPQRAIALPAAGGARLSHGQRLLFTEQLSYLLTGGMTLDVALGVLAKRLKQPAVQGLTQSLHQALVDGRSFSQSLREHPRVFSPLYVSLVQSGEASGALPSVLGRLVSHLMDTKALRDRVQQALVYPAFLALVGVALVIVFITVMVPQLTQMFTQVGNGSLPLPTRILVGAHALITRYWWLALGVGAAAFAGFRMFTRTPAGRLTWDRTRLSIPGIGEVVKHRFYAQFARTMATLLGNGVTLLRAVELLEDIAGNAFLRARMIEARAALVDGSSLSAALTRQGIFPELFIDMLSVGEQSGRFAETMGMIADVYERELDRRVRFASALIPPVIIVIVALLVGAVVFGILSAVFGVTQSLRVIG